MWLHMQDIIMLLAWRLFKTFRRWSQACKHYCRWGPWRASIAATRLLPSPVKWSSADTEGTAIIPIYVVAVVAIIRIQTNPMSCSTQRGNPYRSENVKNKNLKTWETSKRWSQWHWPHDLEKRALQLPKSRRWLPVILRWRSIRILELSRNLPIQATSSNCSRRQQHQQKKKTTAQLLNNHSWMLLQRPVHGNSKPSYQPIMDLGWA